MASAQTQTHLCPPKTDGGVKKAVTLTSQVTQLLVLPMKGTEGGTIESFFLKLLRVMTH